MIIELKVTTLAYNNGDGSATIHAFNDDQAMFDYIKERKGRELTEQEKEDISCNDNPYENGYLDESKIRLEVLPNGDIRLAEPFYLYADGV
jgi:hypothetical protein